MAIMSANEPKDDFVEVYHTDSTFVARKILDVVLVPEGINAIQRDRTDLMFPGLGRPGGAFVAVPVVQQAEALRLLNEAVENGYLTNAEGRVLNPPPKP